MANRIQLRRDTALNWSAANPILAQGEMGFESDTNQFKIGDGTSSWNDLTYFSGGGGGGGGDSAIRLDQVFPQNIKWQHDYSESEDPTQYEKNISYRGLPANICFTLNCSKSKMINEKENLYVVLDRYKQNISNKSELQANLKFRRQNDRRLQTDIVMHCWRIDAKFIGGNESDPTQYRYFYTTSDYGDDVSSLINDNPYVYFYRSHGGEQDYRTKPYGEVISNWATCLNALYTNKNSYQVSDYRRAYNENDGETQDADIYRCPEFDVNTVPHTHGLVDYFRRMFCRKYKNENGIFFFWSDWLDPDCDVYGYFKDGSLADNEIPEKVTDLEVFTTVDDFTGYTFMEERRDLLWLRADLDNYSVEDILYKLSNNTFNISMQSNPRKTKAFQIYWWDYPIMPVRLSECEVLVMEALPPDPDLGEIGYKVGTWVKFNELIHDQYGSQQWELLKQPIFRLPYDTYDLWMRFSGWQKKAYYQGTYDDTDNVHIQYLKNRIPVAGPGDIEKYRRTGSKHIYKAHANHGSMTEHVQFTLCTWSEVVHNKKADCNAIKMTLALRGNRRSTLL